MKTCKLTAFALVFGLSGAVALPGGSDVVFGPGTVAWADDCPPNVESCIEVTAPRVTPYTFPLSPMGLMMRLQQEAERAAWEAEQKAKAACDKAKEDAAAAGAIGAIAAGATVACGHIRVPKAAAICAAAVSAAITACLTVDH